MKSLKSIYFLTWMLSLFLCFNSAWSDEIMECDFDYPNSPEPGETPSKFYWVWYSGVLTTSFIGTPVIQNISRSSHYTLYKAFTMGSKEFSYIKDFSGLDKNKNKWIIISKPKLTEFFPKEWKIIGATKDVTTFQKDATCTQENIDEELKKLSDSEKQNYILHIEKMIKDITTNQYFKRY